MRTSATARACANIAFIKYWGNADEALRLPVNGSLSMNLAGLHTTTTVSFDTELKADRLTIDGQTADRRALERVANSLDHVRRLAGLGVEGAILGSALYTGALPLADALKAAE